MLNHKDMTAHIRKRLKVAGVKARVSKYEACGVRYIRVVMPRELFEGECEWPGDDARTIAQIADANHLKSARAQPIDVELFAQLTKASQFDFEYHGKA